MRRLLSLAALLLAILAATPAAAWDRPHRGGWGGRPAPAWHHPHPHHRGWHRPWRHDRHWRHGGHHRHRPHHAWRHHRGDGWGYRRGR